MCLSVCLSGTNLSKALYLHLSLIGLSQVSLRSVSGQSQVSLESVSSQSPQVSLRFTGKSQVSLCAYLVRQTEPKILCLVFIYFNHFWVKIQSFKLIELLIF